MLRTGWKEKEGGVEVRNAETEIERRARERRRERETKREKALLLFCFSGTTFIKINGNSIHSACPSLVLLSSTHLPRRAVDSFRRSIATTNQVGPTLSPTLSGTFPPPPRVH
ncbi:hypothetical protein CEXT_509441 [Caerostris extrusa]|uniref:Uncharacterized protein n=1 Tax=Caerostris extrusa TaxID=172846 RepID=A0AAV4NB58_CAEEX|nr:hypothetical protein CEXT_509441 [Caerostris extrusa]